MSVLQGMGHRVVALGNRRPDPLAISCGWGPYPQLSINLRGSRPEGLVAGGSRQ
jgi:hypothetical protein